MLEIYAGPTPNGRIPLLAAEEMSLEYELHIIDLFAAAHYQPEYLKLNPAAQIPVVVDPEVDPAEPLVISQTAAILIYLAERTSKLLPSDPKSRARAYEALALHVSDLAPAFYLRFHLERLLHTKDEGVRSELGARGMKYYAVLEQWIGDSDFLAGNEISIADMAVYPWAKLMPDETSAAMPNLAAWRQRLDERPAVQRAMAVDLGTPVA